MSLNLGGKICHHYQVVCRDRDGRLVWAEEFDNLVVTEGRNKYIDATLNGGLPSPAWYVGLKGSGTAVAGDTLASHSGWSELTPYFGDRPAFTPGDVANGAVDNSGSRAAFEINAYTTVYGAFMVSAASGTSGTLLGAGDFAAPQVVLKGYTLYVTVTCSLS